MSQGLQFHGSFSKLAGDAKEISYALEKTAKKLHFYLGAKKGFNLNKPLAQSCAEYIRGEIKTQRAFAGCEGLSDSWKAAKKRYGLPMDIGIVRGHLMNAIKAIPQGDGKYMVGIDESIMAKPIVVTSPVTKKKIKIGTYDKLYEVARVLELGDATISGKRTGQTARPFFMYSFYTWLQTTAPSVVREHLINDAFMHLQRIMDRFNFEGGVSYSDDEISLQEMDAIGMSVTDATGAGMKPDAVGIADIADDDYVPDIDVRAPSAESFRMFGWTGSKRNPSLPDPEKGIFGNMGEVLVDNVRHSIDRVNYIFEEEKEKWFALDKYLEKFGYTISDLRDVL